MDAERMFTHTQRVIIERTRKYLVRHLLRPITVVFWKTSDGAVGVASFCVDGTGQDTGPLASISTGPFIAGDGYAVDAADGSPLAEGVTFVYAAQVARLAALRSCREPNKARVSA